MKPITLKLSGLQSYREIQEIDFEELCDTGLFGIFGPTGSGKSTILDAITLALYGKVGRASGGTQGIMNHSEDTLFVSFTFELTSAQGVERYRVERRFKRQSDISVSNTISRFIDIAPEGEKVLADKLADVTRCVEQKIGLKMDDFTRAVVLPQGKFAEFLSLKGADRRAMLQRLFHLEKYGDLLGQKLTRKVKETERRRGEVAAEQQGLGNASEEAVKAAAEAVREAAELAALRRRELGSAQQQYDQLAKVRELSEERSSRAAQLTALREQGAGVAALETKLALGAAAEALRPGLAAWREAQQAAAERERQAAAAAASAQAAAAAATQASEEAAAAAAALGREEPALLLRLDQLEQARSLQVEVAQLLAEQLALQAQHEAGQHQLKSLMEQAQKEEQLLAKAQTRQRELEQQLKDHEVKSTERQQIQTAVQLSQQLAQMREQLVKAEAEEAAGRAQYLEAEQRLESIKKKEQTKDSAWLILADRGQENYRKLSVLESAVKRFEESLLQQESALRIKLKEREKQIWSARLAVDLQSEEPCPVCGSVHHPLPATQVDDPAVQNDAELDELTGVISAIREVKLTVAQDFELCRGLMNLLGISIPEDGFGSETGSSQAAATVEAPESAGLGQHTTISDYLAEARRKAEVLKRERSGIRQQLELLQKEIRAAQSETEMLRPQRSSAEASLAAVSGVLEQAVLRTVHIRESLTTLLKQWKLAYPDLLPEEALQKLEEYTEKDRKSEDLRQRLSLSVPFIEEKSANLQKLSRETVELEKMLLQWQVQEQGKRDLLQEKQGRLFAWVGDRPVDELLLEASQQLDLLRKTAEANRNRETETIALSHELAKADALARQAAAAARDQETSLRSRWLLELDASPFTDEASVRAALLENGQADKLTEIIQNHRTRERELEIALSELATKLEGRTVSEEQWQECSSRLNLAKEQDEEALQLKARSERDLEDLQARHVRWQELEQTRVRLEHESGLLAKLQSSLRGNAFVEYVAEEQLMNVSQSASQRLRFLTKQRYALETDSGGGFVICDDANGGVKRPVATLSGGETFLTSLALALALSAQIQLRGQYPLQFFFLDEGFGTLDPELLDTVITSLEHLHHDQLSVGIISHVAELRSRLARKLIVIPAENGGAGSKIMIERM